MNTGTNIAVVGGKGTGKSCQTLGALLDVANDKNIANRKNILIVDINNEYGGFMLNGEEVNIDLILVEDIPEMLTGTNPSIKRIVPIKDGKSIGIEHINKWIANAISMFHDGILLIEDVSKYLSPKDFSQLCVNFRIRNISGYFHFQSIRSAIKYEAVSICDYVRMHNTNDSIKESDFPSDLSYRSMCVAKNIVRNQLSILGNRYYTITVRLQNYDVVVPTSDLNKFALLLAIHQYYDNDINTDKLISQIRKDKSKMDVIRLKYHAGFGEKISKAQIKTFLINSTYTQFL